MPTSRFFFSAIFGFAAYLSGCPEPSPNTHDTSADVIADTAIDVGNDASVDTATDASVDTATDTSGDTATADTGGDTATTDTGGDTATADTGVDTATTDTGGDTATTDTAADTATTDTGGDDATTDSGSDVVVGPTCDPVQVGDLALVASGAEWAWDTGTDHGTSWLALDFDDSAWSVGKSELGFGDSDEATVLPASAEGEPTYYFRRVVYVDGTVQAGTLDVLYDDGIAVWINGTEVFVNNVDGLDYADWASSTLSDNETASTSVPTDLFVDGLNIVTAVVKNRSASSSDISFDLTLTVDLDTCAIAGGGTYSPVVCDDAINPPLASSGLPLLQSNPGAPVALFLDFDGGVYASTSDPNPDPDTELTSLTGYDTDGDGSAFSGSEQQDIIRSWRHVAEYYAMFDVNVTTDQDVLSESIGWGWILITGEVSGGLGSTSSAAVGTPGYARSYVGDSTVTSSDKGRRIAHELGHNLTLEHNGVWESSTVFLKWEDWTLWDHVYGPVMGGGGEGQVNGWAIAHSADGQNQTQDSMAVIEQRVVNVGGGASGWRGDDFGDASAATMCDGGYFLRRQGVLGHPQDEDLFGVDWPGGSAMVDVHAIGVSAADPVVDVLNASSVVIGGEGFYADLPAGTYFLRVRTQSGLSNGYDKSGPVSYDDLARSELGAYEITID